MGDPIVEQIEEFGPLHPLGETPETDGPKGLGIRWPLVRAAIESARTGCQVPGPRDDDRNDCWTDLERTDVNRRLSENGEAIFRRNGTSSFQQDSDVVPSQSRG